MANAPIIETHDLTKFYGSVRGVEALDLRIFANEVFGLLGPNGAGKTTIIRLLLGFIRPTAGYARAFGLDTWADSTAIKRQMAYLPSSPALYGGATGLELLRLLSRLRGVASPHRQRELAERLQVDLHRPIRTLSRGNRQKVALLLTFATQAPLLVLDEPSTGLDPIMQFEVTELIRQHRREGGAVILASHSLREAEQVCDRVAMLQEGRLLVVEEVAKLRSQVARNIEVWLERPLDPATLHLHGVTILEASGPRLRLAAHGPIDALMRHLAAHGIRDLVVEAPDLQDIFLHYYRRRDGRPNILPP